jgi:Domain of unknown function (DUF3786)
MPPLDPSEISLYRREETIPLEHWSELRLRNPHEITKRALVSFHPGQGYRIPFLNQAYFCRPEEATIRLQEDPERSPSFQICLVLLMYLLKAQPIPFSGRKITEKEIPGGQLFFQGPHALFKKPLENHFGQDPGAFLEAGLSWGGQSTGQGDASFELLALPRIPLEYILYARDEEFSAQLVITFDSTIHLHLPLDAIWALVNLIGRRLLVISPGDTES